MFQQILNLVCLRKLRAGLLQQRFAKCLEDELAEEFLELLLRLMGLVFYLDPHFRRNIRGFSARYLFQSKDSGVVVAVIFANNEMIVKETEIASTNITVVFRDQQTLMKFLLAPAPDVLQAMLSQDISYEGNIYYLAKFAYMAKHLQLQVQKVVSG